MKLVCSAALCSYASWFVRIRHSHHLPDLFWPSVQHGGQHSTPARSHRPEEALPGLPLSRWGPQHRRPGHKRERRGRLLRTWPRRRGCHDGHIHKELRRRRWIHCREEGEHVGCICISGEELFSWIQSPHLESQEQVTERTPVISAMRIYRIPDTLVAFVKRCWHQEEKMKTNLGTFCDTFWLSCSTQRELDFRFSKTFRSSDKYIIGRWPIDCPTTTTTTPSHLHPHDSSDTTAGRVRDSWETTPLEVKHSRHPVKDLKNPFGGCGTSSRTFKTQALKGHVTWMTENTQTRRLVLTV